MLFETHLGIRQGEQGEVTSPIFMESSANCKIDYYYHMKGAHIGSLDLSLFDSNGSKLSCIFFQNSISLLFLSNWFAKM